MNQLNWVVLDEFRVELMIGFGGQNFIEAVALYRAYCNFVDKIEIFCIVELKFRNG